MILAIFAGIEDLFLALTLKKPKENQYLARYPAGYPAGYLAGYRAGYLAGYPRCRDHYGTVVRVSPFHGNSYNIVVPGCFSMIPKSGSTIKAA